MQKFKEPVIFLDFDGVLITKRTHIGLESKNDFYKAMDPVAIGLLNKITNDYNVKFVVSSTWRKMSRQHSAKDMLISNGFKGVFHENWYTPITFSERRRGSEIQDWLEEHPDTPYCIIDDSVALLDEHFKWAVITDENEGFIFKDYEKVRKILNEIKEIS